VKIILGLAALADFALAALLVAVSGFIFDSGPEGLHAGPWFAVAYGAAVCLCIALPVAGFVLNARKKTGLALVLAFLPPVATFVVNALPPGY